MTPITSETNIVCVLLDILVCDCFEVLFSKLNDAGCNAVGYFVCSDLGLLRAARWLILCLLHDVVAVIIQQYLHRLLTCAR